MSSPPLGAGPVGEEACLEAGQKLVSSLPRMERFCAVSTFSFRLLSHLPPNVHLIICHLVSHLPDDSHSVFLFFLFAVECSLERPPFRRVL